MPVSTSVKARVRREFFPEHHDDVIRQLNVFSQQGQSLHAAVVYLSQGNPTWVERWIAMGEDDYRDLLLSHSEEVARRRKASKQAEQPAGEEERFLEAIRQKPDDQACRSVYADWLEERGDPRAPYLRVLGEWIRCREEATAATLIARERELRAGFDPDWLAAIRGLPPPKKKRKKSAT